MATAITMHKRHNPVSKKKNLKKLKKSKKSTHHSSHRKTDEFSQLIKEICSMPEETDKCYACAALPSYWNNGGTHYVAKETDELLKFFQKYFGDDIDDMYIENWIRIGMFTTNNRLIAEQFVNLCNTNIIRCYGRGIRAYHTKYNRKYLVHILNINWCINHSKFNQWIHESFLNNYSNKTFQCMKISNIQSFCSPLNPSEIDKKVIIKLNNEITRDWLLKNEDIKFKNWPFYFHEWSIITNDSIISVAESDKNINAPNINININKNTDINTDINNTCSTHTLPIGSTFGSIPIVYNYNWSVDDVERLLLNTKLAEQEQLINNLIVQNKLLNDQYIKQQQLLTALQTQNHSVIFDEFIQQKNMNIRLNIKYNELFAKYAKVKTNGNGDENKTNGNGDENKTNVLQWSVEDVICWVLGLENGRFLKHKHAIIPNIINQQIDGQSLIKLKLIDISRIGITSYWDQEWLMHGIKKLIKKNINKK
eukprot:482746_1